MQQPVAVIGLGNMGGRIARRLVASGFDVYGYDIRPDRAREIGINAVGSVADACRQAGVILMSLPHSRAVEQVVLGEDGILASARPGTIVADLTTADPVSTRRLHQLLAEREITLIDTPVSGGPLGAEAGTLTIIAGGSEAALEKLRPVFAAFSRHIFHMGEIGNGHAAKAVNNFLNFMNLAATAEAMVVGVKAGLDPEKLLNVINASSGKNWASEHRFPHIIKGDYVEGGLSNRLTLKDLDLYVGLARNLEVPCLLGQSCISVFSLATALGYADKVSNYVVDVIGRLAGDVWVQVPDAFSGAGSEGV